MGPVLPGKFPYSFYTGFFIGMFVALQKHGEQCSRFSFPSASFVFSCDSCLQFSARGGFVVACNKQSLVEKTLASLVFWCWVAAEVGMLCPALGTKGECFSSAFLLMQKQFLETGFFYFTQLPVPELVFRCSSLPSATAPQLLQDLGGTGSGCKSLCFVTVAIPSSLTCRC